MQDCETATTDALIEEHRQFIAVPGENRQADISHAVTNGLYPNAHPERFRFEPQGEMEIHDEPVGYFITWSVYGTFLQGDARWWRKKNAGDRPPQPVLEQWHQDRLKHDVILLNEDHRKVVESETEYHCRKRGWKLWVVNPRTNHVHVVVTAAGYTGDQVRDQLKANGKRGIREIDDRLMDRPVRAAKGDVQFLKMDDDLERVIS